MQFKVPQNVQRADTIVGPLTWKQLIILGSGGGICYAIYVSLAKTYFMEVWLPPIVVIGGLTLAMAFIKIYGLEFEKFLLCFNEYHFLPKKRIWQKGQADSFAIYLQRRSEEKKEKVVAKVETQEKKQSIQELSKILDNYGNLEKEENPNAELMDALGEKQQKKEMLKKIINHTT